MQKFCLGLFVTLSMTLLVAVATAAQPMATNPARFGAMTCQQLWYLEQGVLAEGKVCLKSDRARRAFQRAGKCIASDEAILSSAERDYLSKLRDVGKGKGCPGF